MIGDARPNFARALGTPSARDLSFGLAFLGLAAIAVGCFVPVADAGSVNFDRIQGNSLRLSGIGWLTLLLCGVLVTTLTRSLRRGEPTWGPLIGGLLVVTEAVYVGAVELTTCPVGTNVVDPACQAASPGLGLFMIGGGGAALALAGLELAPWRQPVQAAGNRVVTGPHRQQPSLDVEPRLPGQIEIEAEKAATLAYPIPERTMTHAPPGPRLDREPPPADVGSHVTAILVAAEELAAQIVADARAEAARITSTLESIEQAGAESQRRRAEEAAKLLHTCRAVEHELLGAIRELAALTESHPGRPTVTSPQPPRQADEGVYDPAGGRALR